MYKKFKELAQKNKFFRCLYFAIVAAYVFYRLLIRYYMAWKKGWEHIEGKRLLFRELVNPRHTRAAICTTLIIALICGTVNSSASDQQIVGDEKNITFSYERGIGNKLYNGNLNLDNEITAEYPKEGTLDHGDFRMSIQSDGFEGDLYQGMEAVYPLVISNIGVNMLTNIHIETGSLQLQGYDEKLSELLLLQKAPPEEPLVSPDNAVLQDPSSGSDPVPEQYLDMPEDFLQEAGSLDESEENTIDPPEGEAEAITSPAAEDDNNSDDLKLEDLTFDLCPGEKVTLYLTLPEGCPPGIYNDQIRVAAEEFQTMYAIDINERIYAAEGAPWQTTPDKNAPIVSYDEDKLTNTIQLSDGFDFQVLEEHEEDSGIGQVECYLNGEILDLKPKALNVSQRDEQEIIVSGTYHIDFAEPGIQSLLIKATDLEGNQNVCELEITAVCREKYHVTLPDKIHFVVDPDMAYGDSQIYNDKDFIIKNKSQQSLMVSVESLDINDINLGNVKDCTLNMTVLIDGQEYCCVPVTETNGQYLCRFLLKGMENSNEGPHQASLVFKGSLASTNENEWQNGNIAIQYKIKLSVLE